MEGVCAGFQGGFRPFLPPCWYGAAFQTYLALICSALYMQVATKPVTPLDQGRASQGAVNRPACITFDCRVISCKIDIARFHRCDCWVIAHAGGRGVIEGLGSQLGLSQRQLEPSSSTLYWYGNTSSSSLWYALSYIESRQTVHKGDRVWQVILCIHCLCLWSWSWLWHSVLAASLACALAQLHTASTVV